MNHYVQDQEQVYQCQDCGQLYPESTVGVRINTKEKYCTICQGKVKPVVSQ